MYMDEDEDFLNYEKWVKLTWFAKMVGWVMIAEFLGWTKYVHLSLEKKKSNFACKRNNNLFKKKIARIFNYSFILFVFNFILKFF